MRMAPKTDKKNAQKSLKAKGGKVSKASKHSYRHKGKLITGYFKEIEDEQAEHTENLDKEEDLFADLTASPQKCTDDDERRKLMNEIRILDVKIKKCKKENKEILDLFTLEMKQEKFIQKELLKLGL